MLTYMQQTTAEYGRSSTYYRGFMLTENGAGNVPVDLDCMFRLYTLWTIPETYLRNLLQY